MSAFSVENPHDGKMFENYTRFEWGVEVGVVTIFMLKLFVPHEFDMITETCCKGKLKETLCYEHHTRALFFICDRKHDEINLVQMVSRFKK